MNEVRVDNAVVSRSFARRNLYDVSKFSTGYFPVKKYQTDDVTRNVLRVSALAFCLAIYLLVKKNLQKLKCLPNCYHVLNKNVSHGFDVLDTIIWRP